MTDREALAALLHQRYAGALCISDQDLHEWSECENTRQWKEDARFLAAGVTLTPSLDEGLREALGEIEEIENTLSVASDGYHDSHVDTSDLAARLRPALAALRSALAQEGETPT